MYFAPFVRSVRASVLCWMSCFLLSLTCVPQLSAEMVDKVVAVVNNDIITLSELEKEGEHLFRKIASNAPPEQLQASLAAARAEILDAMIDQRLIEQKAAEKRISVSEAEVDKAFAEVMRRTGMSREQLLVKVDQSGMDETSYRSTLRSQLLQNKLLGTDISSKIIITEEMIVDFYNTEYKGSPMGPTPRPAPKAQASGSYYLLQIGCSWQKSSKDEALKRARKARERAVAGEDFSQLARQYSDLPSKVDGGDIGSFELDELAAYMRGAIAGLGTGEVSQIVETPAGFQFFKVVSGGVEKPAGNMLVKAPLDQVRSAIKKELYEQEMRKAYGEWVQELKGQAYIQKL